MRWAVATAILPLLLSCAAVGGRGTDGHDGAGGMDPSLDRYLAENFLDLPSSLGRTFEAGAGVHSIGSSAKRYTDDYIRAAAGPLRIAMRRRVSADGIREAFHFAVMPSSSMRIDAGDFVPDFGAGLVSSGRRFSYPFSSGYPFYRSRGIRGWTGLYGRFIRGGSISVAAGPCLLTALAGGYGSHDSGGTVYDAGRPVTGIRVESGTKTVRIGVAAVDRGSSMKSRITGCDLAVSSRGRTLLIECAASGRGRISSAWGLTTGKGGTGWGLLGWSVPAGSEGFLASFPGLSTASGRYRSGLAVSARARLPLRMHIGLWGEVRRSGDEDERIADSSLRCEIGVRQSGWDTKWSWSSRDSRSERVSPYPPGEPQEIGISRQIAVSASARPSKGYSITIEIRHPYGNDWEGTLLCMRWRKSFPRGPRLRLSMAASVYGSGRGKARFSLYEPSAGGTAPWRTVYGSGRRLSLLIDTPGSRLGFSVRLLWSWGSPVEGSAVLMLAI